MKIRCVAIDDEPLALALMQEYIARTPQFELVKTFDDAIEGKLFLQQNSIDLLLADINMPDISGIDLVRSLQERPMIIFTTAYKNYALEGFELDAVDYLLKPISYERFTRAVTKAAEYFEYKHRAEKTGPDSLFVYSEYRLVKIPLADIEYIESLEDYIRIHLITGKPIMTLMTMKKVLEKLPQTEFRRIHRGYIVSVSKVKSILNKKARLQSGAELPISDSYLDFITEWRKV